MQKSSSFLLILSLSLLAFLPLQAQDFAYPKIPPDRLEFIQGALKEALEKKDAPKLAEAWYLYGKTYAGIGNYKAAQECFFKSLKIQERYGDSYLLGRIYLRLCDMEFAQGHFHETLRYAEQSKKIFQHAHSDKGMLTYYSILANVHRKRWEEDPLKAPAKHDSLVFFYKKILSMAERQKDTLLLARTCLQTGNLLANTKPLSAITYINKALQLYSNKNKSGKTSALVSIATVYINTDQYKLAFEALTKANQFYNDSKLNDVDLQILILRNFVLYFRATGDWKKAFEYLEKLNLSEKKQIIADRNGALTRLNLEYGTEKREKLLAAQRKEIALRNDNLRKQQNFTWALAALLVTAVGAGVVYFRLYRKNQKTSQWNAELLQEQNHRVKNNLQIVSSLLNMQSKRLTDEVAKRAVEETRLRVESMAILHRSLYDGEKFAEVDLSEFIREVVHGVLKSYGYDHLRPDFEIAHITMPAEKAIRLGLILNELSTNACKYALPYHSHPRFSVRCDYSGSVVDLIVKDNGPGIEKRVLEHEHAYTRKNTLGISLIQTLVVQLRGQHQFVSGSDLEGGGTEFKLKFKF